MKEGEKVRKGKYNGRNKVGMNTLNKLFLAEFQGAYNALRDRVTAVEKVGGSGREAPLSQNVATDGIV